jgi:putative ABC transport system ATP-binding protein
MPRAALRPQVGRHATDNRLPHPSARAGVAARDPDNGQPSPAPEPVVLDRVCRRYGRGGRQVQALSNVTVRFAGGTVTAVVGASGSGKSTLLQCAAGLDKPTSGTVRIGGADLSGLSRRKLSVLRRRQVGFVFQSLNLVLTLTTAENIALPLRLDGRRVRKDAVARLGAAVGISAQLGRLPHTLSGGQQQRAAIRRALITSPDVIFADKPTAALDVVSAVGILGPAAAGSQRSAAGRGDRHARPVRRQPGRPGARPGRRPDCHRPGCTRCRDHRRHPAQAGGPMTLITKQSYNTHPRFPCVRATHRLPAQWRQLLVLMLTGGGFAMIPWLAVLASFLPQTTTVPHWNVVWVGLDALEAIGLLATGQLIARGDRRYAITATLTGTALLIDVWFDILTSASRSELLTAIAMAAVLEAPLSGLCFFLALRAIPGPGHART